MDYEFSPLRESGDTRLQEKWSAAARAAAAAARRLRGQGLSARKSAGRVAIQHHFVTRGQAGRTIPGRKRIVGWLKAGKSIFPAGGLENRRRSWERTMKNYYGPWPKKTVQSILNKHARATEITRFLHGMK